MRKYNTLAGGGEEEALRLSSSGAEPGINCNNSSSMSEITEGGKGGYPHRADKRAREHTNTGEQTSAPVDTSDYTRTHNFIHCEQQKQGDEKPIKQRKIQ